MWRYGLIILITILLGYAVGRYLSPTKIITQTETQTVTQIVYKEKQDINKDMVTIIEEVTHPDGTVTKKTTIVDKSVIASQKESAEKSESQSKTQTIKEMENKQFMVSVMAGLNTFADRSASQDIVLGIHVQKRFLGPIHLGAFGYSNKLVGVSVGLNF